MAFSKPTITDDDSTGETGTIADAAFMDDYGDRIDAAIDGAEKLGGQLAAFYLDASNLNAGTMSGDRLPNPLPAVSGENLTNLPTPPGTVGLHELYIPALAMRPLSTGGCGTIEDATSTNTIAGLPFDPTSSEGAFFWIQLPKSWNRGTVTATFSTFNKAGGSGNFVFSLAGVAVSNDESISAALGTAQQVTDGILAAYDAQISAPTDPITIAGTPAVGDWILFVVKRLPADGSDTYGSDVFLQGVQLTLTTDAENDA